MSYKLLTAMVFLISPIGLMLKKGIEIYTYACIYIDTNQKLVDAQ